MENDKDLIIAKLLKKIAELSIIIDNLYKSNHHLQVSSELFKDEISKRCEKSEEKYKEKIKFLESQLDKKEENLSEYKKLRKINEELYNKIEFMKEKDVQTKEIMKIKDESLDVYRTENQNLKIELKQLRKIVTPVSDVKIENPPRDEHNFELEKLKGNYDAQISQHLARIDDLENILRETETKNLTRFQEVSFENDALKKQIEQVENKKQSLQEKLDERHANYQKLEKQKKNVIIENRLLEATNRQLTSEIKVLKQQKNNYSKTNGKENVESEEIMNLQKELEKYRLEIINRERNFHIFSLKPTDSRGINLTGIRNDVTFGRRAYLPYLPEYPKPKLELPIRR